MARNYDRDMRTAEAAMGGGFFHDKARRETLEHSAGRNYTPKPGEMLTLTLRDAEGFAPATIAEKNRDGSVRVDLGGRGCHAASITLRPLAEIRALAALIGGGCSNREWRERCGDYPHTISAHERQSIVAAESRGYYAENAAAVVAQLNADHQTYMARLRAELARATA